MLTASMLLTVSLVLPSTPLNLVAAHLCGSVWRGALFFDLGCTFGSVINFFLGRFCCRRWAKRKIQSSKILSALELALQKRSVRLLLLIRLSPIFPYAIVGYAMGVSAIGLFLFTWTTFVGSLPGCLLYAWMGMSMSQVFAGEAHQIEIFWSTVYVIVGVLLTVIITWQVKKAVDAALYSVDKMNAERHQLRIDEWDWIVGGQEERDSVSSAGSTGNRESAPLLRRGTSASLNSDV